MGLDHVRRNRTHAPPGPKTAQGDPPASAPRHIDCSGLSLCSGGCRRRLRRAVQRKDACLAAGAGDARTTEMVRQERRQFAVARCACRIAAAGHARGSLLSARPGDHRCDRPVRREGARQPRLLPQQALRRRLALPRRSGRALRILTVPNSDF
jgi:hypothetical protein